MIEARAITREGVNALLRLKVRPDQDGLVAPNPVTIAQAAYEPQSWVRGLYEGDRPVGLMAMIDMPGHPDTQPHDPEDAAYLWRLMIADTEQGKGYGAAALALAFDQARVWGRSKLAVHVVEREDSALDLYIRAGLRPTDIVEEGERLLVGPVPPAPAA
ncbi:GNAT family N-acetyltransferase [Oceanomicrobium pacificus]|uniref:GNAT family N-acetyltransferase n=1 Tax=Oceanomicrobium pacificus TaxID=2692916 RepID=A0A6B0TS75_9RHOB|nr:GNAT family N-acetyltransferase [Oceanomicrobium pacificus]MXU64052.1 GNAT family N-acetyltransferase [Oceanomicrobium pacificus]